MSTHQLGDSIVDSPITGTIITGGSLAASHLLPLVYGGHINPMVMDLLQVGGYLTTIVVGLVTIYGYMKKFKNSK
jgi:hypothetical protein